jgi:MFS family permease
MMIGAAGSLMGYVSLAYAPNVFWAYLGFGCFGGTAAGFVYATCVNMVGKWYPERKGGKTGFVNGGFAYGSVPFIFIFTSYLDVSNYRGILFGIGVFLAVLVAASGFFFKDPPKNWWPAHVDPIGASTDPRIARALRKNPPAKKQYTPMEAIKTGILPMMWFVLLCTAGINIFGIAMQVPFGKEMGFAGGIVALAMSLKAIINGTGRWISDRFGRRETLVIVCLVLGLAQYAVYLSGSIGNMPLFLLASMVSGFGGGAIFPLFAAMTADYFGENNNATNYGLVYSSKVISGLVGAGLGSVVVSNWGYGAAFMIAGSVGVGCAFITLLLRQPKLPESEHSTSGKDEHPKGRQEEAASLTLD